LSLFLIWLLVGDVTARGPIDISAQQLAKGARSADEMEPSCGQIIDDVNEGNN
jgi:hypothetical protein